MVRQRRIRWSFVTPLLTIFLALSHFLEDDEGNAEVREAYIDVLADLLGYIGCDDAEAADAAQAVYDLERALVEPTLTREESQDASLSYNPTTVADLAGIYPLMDWDA